jgi:hypothetical protein
MRRALLLAALLALATALAGCGGSSKPKAQAGLVGSSGSAGQSTDYKPTGKIIADDGFRPDPNGFSFENYPNFQGGVPENLVPTNVYDLFGPRVCQQGSSSSCVLTPTAQKWMDVENQRMAGGHCMGFSVTALRFFAHNLPTRPFGADTTFGLPIRDNLPLQSQLAEDWVFQDLQRVQTRKVAGTPTQVLQALVDALKSSGSSAYSGHGYGSRGELYTLVIFKPDGSGGHAITPYAVEDQGNGHYVVLVYDNNFPGVTRPLDVNTNTDTWKYVGGINPSDTNEIYTGGASSGNFFLLPTSPGLGTQPCPFCGGGSRASSGGAGSVGGAQQYYSITLTGSPENHAHLILFSHGRYTGFYHGHYINQIPGAQIVQTLSSQTWSAAPEPEYRVPVSTVVGVVIDATDLTKPDTESITLIGPGLYGGVEDIKLLAGERDVIAFGGGGKGFVYRTTAGHVSTPGLALGLEEHGVGYAMAVAAAGTRGGSQIALYAHPDGSLTWDTSGTKGSIKGFKGFAIYVVEIERLTKQGTAVWSSARIVLRKGWKAALDYRNAVPGRPITVYTGPPGHLTHKQEILPGKHLPGQN